MSRHSLPEVKVGPRGRPQGTLDHFIQELGEGEGARAWYDPRATTLARRPSSDSHTQTKLIVDEAGVVREGGRLLTKRSSQRARGRGQWVDDLWATSVAPPTPPPPPLPV